MTKNFPNLVKKKKVGIQVGEAQESPTRWSQKAHSKTWLRWQRLKTGNLKSSKRKQLVTYQGTPLRLSTDIPTETLQNRIDCHEIFNWWKGPTTKITLPSKAII